MKSSHFVVRAFCVVSMFMMAGCTRCGAQAPTDATTTNESGATGDAQNAPASDMNAVTPASDMSPTSDMPSGDMTPASESMPTDAATPAAP